ncbi:MAG TPA: hypothetical protein PLM41_15075 [Saprospiraceae bacterium]|nr:hypothetical protein [Saprospiraceae bacterium]
MTKRNRLLLTLIMLAPLALAAQSPVGMWKLSIPGQDGKMIPLTVNIADNGTYTLDFGGDGVVETKGKYSLDKDKMTVQDTEGADCTAEGVYTIMVDEKTLTMTRVSDGCPNRGGPEGVMKMERG